MQPRFLLIGGLVAVGFDPAERYLLAISHAGRGVFRTSDWTRIARDLTVVYPDDGVIVGIGPLEGFRIPVTERSSDDPVIITSPSGSIVLSCESDGITIKSCPASPSPRV